jgi:type I protein arginine methyltransferase
MANSDYSVYAFGTMLLDRDRMTAYETALRRHVTPESVVVDIGAGTGIFSFLACQLGARKVYAIEPNPAIEVARQEAAALGLTDRIEFIEALSTDVNLPEQADVVISDLRGVSPLYDHHLPAIIDARSRLLKPDGVLLPQQDTLWAALVHVPELFASYINAWSYGGLELQVARHHALNSMIPKSFKPDEVCLNPQPWVQLDYTQLTDLNYANSLHWSVSEAAEVHGIGLWFECQMGEGLHYSSGPDNADSTYKHYFVPFRETLHLLPGDDLTIDLRANLVEDDYLWRWHTTLVRKGAVIVKWQQSTFWTMPLSFVEVQSVREDFQPSRTSQANIDRVILTQMTGTQTLGEIATRLQTEFPSAFPTYEAALDRAVRVMQRYV